MVKKNWLLNLSSQRKRYSGQRDPSLGHFIWYNCKWLRGYCPKYLTEKLLVNDYQKLNFSFFKSKFLTKFVDYESKMDF